ncbi:glycosyltransferase family 39 protein [Pseudomonadota bacterium]
MSIDPASMFGVPGERGRQNGGNGLRGRDTLILIGVFIVLCTIASLMVARDLSTPGTYYDEVIQAVPAVQFLSGTDEPWRFPGARTESWFGGQFPVMTQGYMGALKSQALIGFFSLFEPTVSNLRSVTLAWAFMGLLFAMLWIRRALGLPEALVAGALVALDPSFLFIASHDWGSFALGFLCRCGGLYFVTRGWMVRSAWQLFVGGCLLGLGIYNKVDFGVFLLASALALVFALPRTLWSGTSSRHAGVAAGLAGLVIGASPMIVVLQGVFEAARELFRGQSLGGGEWSEKLNTAVTMLDGSYFHRLMLSGGSFERMFDVPGAAAGPFLWVFAFSVLVLGAVLLMRRGRGDGDSVLIFVLLTTLLTMIGIFLTPNATRIHHTLNVYPFPQLVVAIVVVWLFRVRLNVWRPALRTASGLLLVLALAGSLYVEASTLKTIRETGGKGRWSDAFDRFATELAGQPGAVVVSLDWGFHGQLLFQAPGLRLIEPIWQMHRSWRLDGSPAVVYLLHEDAYAVFDYHTRFLSMLRGLPSDAVVIRRHADREGDTAFVSVRFTRPHRLIYDGSFKILFPAGG